eukprot:TRINITY_DN5168_c0_g1_i2.p1 TRINITY_DN5168_c0_g1~~TRINITY_DN5168_c0_g1_i2.p1  ORF type:complete len:350 (+),score=28.99 TRINITY_DN5168_c0_g1_i2:57-1052(+)
MECPTPVVWFVLFLVAMCLLYALGDYVTPRIVKAAHALQRAIPCTSAIFEFLVIGIVFARNTASRLPNKSLFWFVNGVSIVLMKSMYTYGADKGAFDCVVDLGNDVFLLRYWNYYFFGKQINESVLIRSGNHVVLYGVCALSPEIEELIGERNVIVVLQYEHHHKWLTVFMNRYPAAIITGSKTALQKHESQVGGSFHYTPLDRLALPDCIFLALIPGVADEEYMLLHKELEVLFCAHFFTNPNKLAGLDSDSWILTKICDFVLWSSKSIESWDGMPTENPTFDKVALQSFKEEVKRHGNWTRVHASHAGLLVPPKFEEALLFSRMAGSEP